MRTEIAIGLALGLLGLAAALAATLGLASPADRRISGDRTAIEVSAQRGFLTWSRIDRGDGLYHLVEHAGGRTFDAPVGPAPGPFDADLGPSELGSPVAVFSRCNAGRPYDCDIRGLDLTQAVTFRVPGAHSGSCAEGAPSIWRGTVAFSRSPRGGGIACERGLFVSFGGRVVRLSARVPQATDLEGKLLAASFVAASASGGPRADANTKSWIELHHLGSGRMRVLVHGSLDRLARGTVVTNPVLDHGTLYHLLDREPGSRRVVGRRVTAGGRDLVTGPLEAYEFSVDGNRLFYTGLRGVFSVGI